ncbi:MAG TPA: RNA methyltransferase [Terracidiphilus sp.]|nr:RNA methyltransferase [Terracidiphilus sp.]
MLNPAQRERLQIVLVSPRNPLNIGAAARAMANFGFTRLTVVAPYEKHWREAQSAVGAPELLLNAKQSATLAEALADCTLAIGTGTLTYRRAEQAVVALPDLTQAVTAALESAPESKLESALATGPRVALVFGPEKHGLTREDLSYCHLLAEIPTDAHQPSMNLGQAVAVCLYELAVRTSTPGAKKPAAASGTSTAQSGDLDLLAGLIDQVMKLARYAPASMRAASQHDLRLVLRRLALGPRDVRRMMGFFRRVLYRLER